MSHCIWLMIPTGILSGLVGFLFGAFKWHKFHRYPCKHGYTDK